MRAVIVDKWLGGVRELTVTETPTPAYDEDTVLVQIEVVGANFFDILLVTGKYQFKPPFPFIPGAEVRRVPSTLLRVVVAVVVAGRGGAREDPRHRRLRADWRRVCVLCSRRSSLLATWLRWVPA